MSGREILGAICAAIAVLLFVGTIVPTRIKSPMDRIAGKLRSKKLDEGRNKTNPGESIEMRLVRIETNITWLVRIAAIQFGVLAAIAFTS